MSDPVKKIDAALGALGGAKPKRVKKNNGGAHARALHKTMVDAMGRALFVSAWADRQEERGKALHGELMDLAPRTSTEAKRAALRLEGQFQALNVGGLTVLLYKAAKADGMDAYADGFYVSPDYARDFGHYLAMEALGHGVSWFDDHAKFDIKFPHIEFYL